MHTKKGLEYSRFPARVFTNEGPQHQWRGLRDQNPRHSTAQRRSAVARRPFEDPPGWTGARKSQSGARNSRMRQGPNVRRSRGRGSNNNGGRRQNNVPLRHQTFDSNGPEVRIRGNAFQVYEKYVTLARDAQTAGDRIAAESYFQHAEHYFRIIGLINEQSGENQRGRDGRNPNGGPNGHAGANGNGQDQDQDGDDQDDDEDADNEDERAQMNA